ncbi:MAG: PrsW family glutamic-type intramembrane protease [Vulcanimicrobiota bacterium]
MMNDALLALAVAPGAGLMYYFYKRDTHEPEPRDKVLKVMGWGAAVSVVAVIVELMLITGFEGMAAPGSPLEVFFHAFIVAALVEELCKYWVVRASVYSRKAVPVSSAGDRSGRLRSRRLRLRFDEPGAASHHDRAAHDGSFLGAGALESQKIGRSIAV